MEASGKLLMNKCCLAALFWLWFVLGTAQASDNSILIIKSHENQFFDQSIEKLINNTEQKVKFNIINVETFKKYRQQYDPSIMITFGQQAAAVSSKLEHNIPTIHTYLTEFQLVDHGIDTQHYTVLLDQPLDRYIHFIQALFPVNKIGLVKTPAHQVNAKKIESLENTWSVEINQYVLHPDDNPISSVRNVLRNNDVLLSLPEPEVYNHQTLKGILLSSYRLNKPVISYSPAHVKSGALAAIYISPMQIGTQTASVLNQILTGKQNELKQINYARDFTISINRQVAHSLNIELPLETVIRKKILAGKLP